MSHLGVHAHLKIRPGQLEGFKTQAAETNSRVRPSAPSARLPACRSGPWSSEEPLDVITNEDTLLTLD